MEKKKLNPILLIAAICLIALAVLSLIAALAYPGSAMMTFSSLLRPGFNLQAPNGLNNQGFPFNGADPNLRSGGNLMGTPQAGRQVPDGRVGQDGMNAFPRPGNNSLTGISLPFSAAMGVFVLLATLSAIFLVRKKKWAGIMALVLAFVTLIVNGFTIYSTLGMARFAGIGNQTNLLFTIIETILALTVIILLMLPKARAQWAVQVPEPVADDVDDDEDDE